MNTLHSNFNGGLMSPRIAGRFDLEKLRTGCVQLKNMLVTPFGGVYKRPGLMVESTTATGSPSRLASFKRSTTTNFILEFKDLSVKVADAITGGTLGTYTTPYAIADVFDLKMIQTNDVMIIVHPSYAPQRFSWLGTTSIFGGNFTFEPVPFVFAPSLDLNDSRIAVQVQYSGIRTWADSWVVTTAYIAGQIIQGTGATAGRIYECILAHTSAAADQPGVGANTATYWTQLATGYIVGDRVLGITAPYQGQIFTCHTAHGSATLDAVDEPGIGSAWTTYWNLGTSSVTVAAWVVGTAYVSTNKVTVGNVVYECTASHTSQNSQAGLNGFIGGNKPGIGQFWTSYWKISRAGTDLSGLAFKMVSTEALFSSDDVGTNWLLELGTIGRFSSLVLSTGTSLGPTEPLFIQGAFTAGTGWNAAYAMIGSLAIEESLDGVTWQKVKEWNQTTANDGNISYEGEAPDVGAWYRISGNRTGTGTSGQGGVFKIEASSAVIKIPFKVETYTSTTSVGGKLLTVSDQLPPAAAIGLSTTAYRKPAFTATEGYPRSVAFHDGRIWYGGTSHNGSRIWASKLDDFYNFLTGTNDDAGLDLTLSSIEANDILWMTSHNRALVVGTTGQEWTIDGGDAETVITPTKSRARLRTRHGSFGPPPETSAESLLWVNRTGGALNEFTYNFQIDGFTAPDMNQLAGRLDGNIIQTAYQSNPIATIWAVTDTGKLYSFIYDREQNITAWSQHTTGEDAGDYFRSVAVTYGDGADEVWFVVTRTVNGAAANQIEKFHKATYEWIMSEGYPSTPGLCWVDGALSKTWGSGLSQSGANVAATSLPNLRGRSVSIMIDWRYPDAVAVVSVPGAATFLNFTGGAGTWWIGIPFESKMQAFPLELQLQDGTGQGRKWRPNRLTLLLHDSLGGMYSDDPDATGYDIEYPSGTTAPVRGRADLHLAADWQDSTQVTFTHSDPVPFGLLGYVLKGEVSGS